MGAEDVLAFWFGKRGSDASWLPEDKLKMWFTKSEETDRAVKEQFGESVDFALTNGLSDWLGDVHGKLAIILVLDQFTRNIFRGDPRSFAGDPTALKLALEALKLNEQQELLPIERVFLYLPLEHSENLMLQERCVELFEELLNESPEAQRKVYENFYDYAIRHRDVIARFGRFPHRNKILGRVSTLEEAAFLQEPGSGF